MPTPQSPPSSDRLSQLLASNASREATDTLRGYDWQRWLTVERWVGLSGEEALWIEWAEDITIADTSGVRTIQAKDISATITLGQAKIRDLISDALLRGPHVRTAIWTRAEAGSEKGEPLGEPGIDHWRKVSAGGTPPDKLRAFLIGEGRLSKDAARCVADTADSALPNLFAKVEWITGEPSLTGLRERILPIIEARLTHLNLPSPSVLRDGAADRAFAQVAAVSVREAREDRRLTRPDLDFLLSRHNLENLVAAAPVIQEAVARSSQTNVPVSMAVTRREIEALPERTAQLIVEKLGTTLAAGQTATTESMVVGLRAEPLKSELIEALQRDFKLRYRRALQRSLFPECRSDEFHGLAVELAEGAFDGISSSLRRQIFLRAARSAAVRKELDAAQRFLEAGLALEGGETELPARARVLEARGESDEAIRLLRDCDDAECLSTMLSIVARHRGDDAALAWFVERGLTAKHLTPIGIVALCQVYLRKSDFEGIARAHSQTTEQQCVENPYLFFFRGAVRLASVVAKPDRQRVLQGVPLNARFVHPVLPSDEFQNFLDAAIGDLRRAQPHTAELELYEAGRIIEMYIRWCELLHPRRNSAALARLREDMAEPKTAVRQVQFALAFDRKFDPKPLATHLAKRDELGGLDNDELHAAFVLQLDSGTPRSVADFIAKRRARLESGYGRESILALEIQALALAQDAASAKLLLEQHKDLFTPDQIALFDAEIAKAEGSDPVTEHLRVYEATKTPEALRALVAALAIKKDVGAFARFSEELYAQTGDPKDIVLTARALASMGDDKNFLRVISAHPFTVEADRELCRYHGRLLFGLGRLSEAQRIAQDLRGIGPPYQDLDLEISVAIESGNWQALGAILDAYRNDALNQSGLSLIRAAGLAQATKQGPMIGLVEAAVAASPNDPNVLIGAYTLALEEGLEDKKPTAMWFSRALDLSGADGPVRKFELKDLLSHATEWNKHTQQISEALARGDLPLFVAALGLRTTLPELMLRNFVHNSTVADPRRRVAVPIFSGRRAPRVCATLKRLAVDVSGLVTMGWLGLLPKIIEVYPQVIVPAGALGELFEAQRRIREFQLSRLARARQVNEAIARGRLKVVRSDADAFGLGKEIGIELAALIEAAEARKGVLLRPAPIHRLGLDGKDADVSMHAAVLADTRGLLRGLLDMGALDQRLELTARRYFDVQDRGWPDSVTPARNLPLFLDGLAVVYLQTVNLFDVVVDRFEEVYVHATVQEQASGVLDYDAQSREVLRVIEEIRQALWQGSNTGKITFGPRTPTDEEVAEGSSSSSTHLLRNLANIDAALIDDRALNKEAFAADSNGSRVHVMHSLDIIDDLQVRGALSDADRYYFRHRLRIAGAALVPVEAEEIVSATMRNLQSESPEFKAVRESVSLARAAEVPRFPAEIPWFASHTTCTKTAITNIWKREPDANRARTLADAILDLQLDPEDWTSSWGGNPPPQWSEAVNRVTIASMAMPFEIEPGETLSAYTEWLERRLLDPLRLSAPARYQAVVEHIKAFIIAIGDRE